MLDKIIEIREAIHKLSEDLRNMTNGECHTRLLLIRKRLDYHIDNAIDEERKSHS